VPETPPEKSLSRRDRLLLAFCRLGPAGLSPKAPGTAGSLTAILLAPFCFLPLPLPWKIFLLLLLFILGGLACGKAEKILGQKDPGELVIDELLGQWLSLLPYVRLPPEELLLALALFRFFDIVKPWPVKASENWLPGGFGVMLDDALAGLYALLLLYFYKSL
jgi:phosphatidylglycerophosphatase A